MSQLNNLKQLVEDAKKEALLHKEGECKTRGMWWWKTNQHEWRRWKNSLVEKQGDNIIGYIYVRECCYCGAEQFKKKRI